MLLTGKDEIVPRGELRENLQHLESPADAQTVEIAGGGGKLDGADAGNAGGIVPAEAVMPQPEQVKTPVISPAEVMLRPGGSVLPPLHWKLPEPRVADICNEVIAVWTVLVCGSGRLGTQAT